MQIETLFYVFIGVLVCFGGILFYLMIKESNELCDYIQESAKKWPRIK